MRSLIDVVACNPGQNLSSTTSCHFEKNPVLMYNPNGMITTKMFYMFSKMFFEVAQWMIHADTATVTLLSIWAGS